MPTQAATRCGLTPSSPGEWSDGHGQPAHHLCAGGHLAARLTIHLTWEPSAVLLGLVLLSWPDLFDGTHFPQPWWQW